MLDVVDDGPGYQVVSAQRQADLIEYLGGAVLQSNIRFASPDMYEDLHWEKSYEFIVPQDGPVTIRICPQRYQDNAKGDPEDQGLALFKKVTVGVGQFLIVFPQYCHRVTGKERFVVMKPQGSFKICAKSEELCEDSEREARGCCPNRDCSLWSMCEEIYQSTPRPG